MYSLTEISEGVRDPRFAALHFNRRFAVLLRRTARKPVNFFDEDWDNLLLLDACRYDMMADVDLEGGTLTYRYSPGSNSEEFVTYHVSEQLLDDVVWVTANPWVSKHRENIFKVIDVWDNRWDEDLQTVPPKAMREAALTAAAEYPNKRLVVHFMQPHYPFIGEYGQSKLPAHRTFTGGGIITETDERSIWDQLQAGTVSKDDVWKAYVENLNVVFPVAKELSKDLRGRTVMSADHGNELGGRAMPIPIRIYGHPSGLRTKNLVKVPWVVYEDTERKKITGGTVSQHTDSNEQVIEERLQALGYHS